MKAAVLYEARTPFVVEELDLAEPGPGEVLVKMMASGVCHSDWHIQKGEWTHIPLPSVLGHEGSGIVEEVGPGVTNVQPGDHVVLSWRSSCTLCEMCQLGWPALCTNLKAPRSRPKLVGTGREINQMVGLGTFGNYTVVPGIAAIPIDKDIPFPQASLVGCGVTTGVGAVINTAGVQPGTSVAVFGCGGVGLNCIQGAVLAGATTIIAVDLLDNKLELGREFGATHLVNASREDPVERIKGLTNGQGVHYAFEAIGLVEAPFVQSITCTRARGITVWAGHAPHDLSLTINARALILEKTVIGSFYGSAKPHVTFSRILSLYKAGKLKIDELISRTLRLEEINSAFEALGKGEVARSVITYE